MIDHVAINVSNISNSTKWYVENLNAKVIYSDETWAMLSIGESKVALTLKDQHPPHIAFNSTIDEIREAYPEEEIKTHRDGSSYIYINDPDNNVIEIIAY